VSSIVGVERGGEIEGGRHRQAAERQAGVGAGRVGDRRLEEPSIRCSRSGTKNSTTLCADEARTPVLVVVEVDDVDAGIVAGGVEDLAVEREVELDRDLDGVGGRGCRSACRW
jgi:hypothetical protein